MNALPVPAANLLPLPPLPPIAPKPVGMNARLLVEQSAVVWQMLVEFAHHHHLPAAWHGAQVNDVWDNLLDYIWNTGLHSYLPFPTAPPRYV